VTQNQMRDWIGKAMESKGFHSEDLGFATGGMVRASLALTEVAEAIQEVKRYWGNPAKKDQEAVRDAVAEEAADTAIRLFDLCYVHGVDLELDPTLEPARPLYAERHSLIVRLGKTGSHAARVFDIFEELVGYTEYGRVTEEDSFKSDGFDGPHDVGVEVLEALRHLGEVCKVIGRDLPAAVEKKMAVNMQRGFRYGTPDEVKAG
jgi:hypothetical protein